MRADYESMAGKIDPEREYTRGAASSAMGLASNAFSRLFKNNSLYLAFSDPARSEGRKRLYKGSSLIAQLERLSDPINGCRLYLDYRELDDEGFREKYGKEKGEVFGQETYLEQGGGWRSTWDYEN